MKRFACLMIAVLMVVAMVGCAKKVQPETEPTAAPAVTEAPAEPQATEEPAGMQPISEKVTISAWYTFGNKNEENFLAAIADFNASQDFITVEATQQTWNEMTRRSWLH